MKRTFTILALAAAASATAQVTQSFENDQLKTFVSNNGTFFRDMLNMTSGYQIPKDQEARAIYMMGLLTSGTDANGQLKAAIGDYTQSDWFPGPVADSYTDPGYTDRYGFALWPMHKELIDYHIAHWQDAGYTPHAMIASWPGNGSLLNGEGHYMAPFSDYNGDGIYNPADGDYPIIRGDHAVLSIINDKAGVHPSGGDAAGLEAHVLLYLYDLPDNEVVSRTTFMNITLINRGTLTLDGFRLGAMMDFDLGNYLDDYIGTMPSADLAYAYNSDLFDEDVTNHPGYGNRPPAIGVTALNENLASHVYIDQNMYPTTAVGFHHLLEGRNPIGAPFTDDNGQETSFVYTETEGGWNEGTAGNPPGDRRTVFSLPPITLLPGSTHCYDLAIVFGESYDDIIFDCVNNLEENTADVLAFYNQQTFACFQQVAGIGTLAQEPVNMYPNPVADVLHLDGIEGGHFRILSTDGKVALEGTIGVNGIAVGALKTGYYIVMLEENGLVRTGKFVKE